MPRAHVFVQCSARASLQRAAATTALASARLQPARQVSTSVCFFLISFWGGLPWLSARALARSCVGSCGASLNAFAAAAASRASQRPFARATPAAAALSTLLSLPTPWPICSGDRRPRMQWRPWSLMPQEARPRAATRLQTTPCRSCSSCTSCTRLTGKRRWRTRLRRRRPTRESEAYFRRTIFNARHETKPFGLFHATAFWQYRLFE